MRECVKEEKKQTLRTHTPQKPMNPNDGNFDRLKVMLNFTETHFTVTK